MDVWAQIAAVAEAVAAIAAVIAILQTIRIQRKQAELTREIHNQQMLLTQRHYLLPLWDRLRELNDIDPRKPVWLDVITAVNILELVAICWEGQLIDENIIRRMFSERYIDIYQKIEQCKDPPQGIEMNGRQMLLASRAAMSLYKQLTDEYVNKDRLTPIQGEKDG